MRERVVDRMEVGIIEPSVEGRHALMGEVLKQRILQEIDVEMDHVELIGSSTDSIEHHEVASDVVADTGEPQPLGNARHESSRSRRIPARKQRDVVALGHQLLGKPGDYPFRPTVQLRWNRLG
jgi:hypothetical protein